MTTGDILFLTIMAGLPILISFVMFRNEPVDRPFFVTLMLAVIGSAMAFVLVSLALLMLGITGLGLFDGIIGFALNVPIAILTGLVIRARRASRPPFSSRVS